MIETGWLIERGPGPGPVWWAAGFWTNNANDAVRFSRRIDAERLVAFLGFVSTTFVTEHSWG